MRLIGLLVVAVIMAVGPPAGTTTEARPIVRAPEYVFHWADEFNGVGATGPDLNKWRVERVDLGATEQASYVDDRRTAFHDGVGNMVLRAIKVPSATGRPYISGRLSNGFVGQNGTGATPMWSTYGRWEARMWIPAGQGVWPAFWLLGDWETVQHWPSVGEVDIMEATNSAASSHGGIHTVAASDGLTHRNFGWYTPARAPATTWAGGWHVWRFDWWPDRMSWWIDGIMWQVIWKADVINAGAVWLFDGTRPQAPIINIAVGGDWAGPASGWPYCSYVGAPCLEMKIDYVKYWRLINY